jgi:hypothetical protein
MKKVFVVAMALLLVVSVSGCWGPMKLTRQLDDWANQMYVDSPWLAQVLLYVGVFGIGFWITSIIDELILNPIDFWGESAFRGWGTPFNHTPPTVPTKR